MKIRGEAVIDSGSVGLMGDLIRRVRALAGYSPVNLQHEIGTGFMLPFHLAEVLRQLETNCVFDVGANVGQYGHMPRRVCTHAVLVALPSNPNSGAMARIASMQKAMCCSRSTPSSAAPFVMS